MTTSRMNRTITSMLLEAKKRPTERIAFKYAVKPGEWKEVHWQEYVDRIQKISAAIASTGIQRGDRVAIMSNTRWEWACTDLAILSAGCVTVPIYQSAPIEDVEFILKNSEAKVVFVEDQGQYEKLLKVAHRSSVKNIFSFTQVKAQPGHECTSYEKAMDLGEKFLAQNKQWFEDSAQKVKLTDLATIVYTSGTTGVPKGVMLQHSCIVSECEDILLMLDINHHDSTLTFLPFAHIFGRVELWMHVYVGWNMGFAESIDRISANLVEVRPTIMLAVPRIFEKVYARILSQAQDGSPLKRKIFDWAVSVGSEVSLYKQKKQEVPLHLLIKFQIAYKLVFSKLSAKMGGRIRFFVSGGAPLSKQIAEFFHAAGILVLEGYGLTETTAAVFVNTPYKYKFGSVGLAIGDTQVKIAEDGEILVRGAKIMSGYYHNDEATLESLEQNGWFHTGDIGELDSEGFLKITDRKKDLIKTAGGKMIAPQKIENALKTNKMISQVVVFGDKMKYLVALLTLNPEELEKFARVHGIQEGDYSKLILHPKVQQLVKEIIQEKNASLGSYETIKNFALLPSELTIENGDLTPSLKVKRKVLGQKYENMIRGLYSEA